MQRTSFLLLLLVAFHCYECLVSPVALGQTATGTILGTIRDSSGSVVPTADVVVTNVDTNISHEFVTDETGSYIVPLLRPGKYRVKASRSGFKSGVQEGIIVGVDQKARVDMTLEVGEVTQIVEVVSNASVISTDSASVGQVIENRRVVELPLNGRNFIQLTYLAPGAVRGVGTNSDLFGQGGSVSVNGSRVQGNNFLIDGTDNNNLLFGGFGINPSVEAIQEFKVQNNTYSSEFGRAGGAQINMTTRGGTNDFRGNLFEFLRNDAFDARNFFAVGNPPLKRNQFGGTFGGPLKFPGLYSGKDRTFFFVAYEGLRLRQGVTLTAITPTAALRSGDFSGGAAIIDPETGLQFPSNRIPASRIDPSARQILDQFYPLPNLATAAPNYSSSLSQKDTSNQFTIRLDHKISDKDSVFFRYSLQDTVRFAPSVFNNFGNSSDYRMQNATLSFIHLFDARKINEFRFGYNRPKGGILFNETFGTDLTKPLGIQGGTPDSNFLSFPALSIAGFAGVGASYFSPISDFSNFFDFIDNFTYIKGTHSLKAGFEIKRNHNNNETGIGYNGRIDFTPTFTRGSALADFLLGLPSLSRIAEGNSREYLRDTGNYFYLADDWKLSPRLTLNLGIRYEYNTPWVETQDRLAGFEVGPDLKLIGPLIAGKDGVSRSIVRPDRNNWAPRFGFAFRPFTTDKTVVRGGYGIFYSQGITNAQFFLRLNPPFLAERTVNSSPTERLLTLQNPFPRIGTLGGAGFNMDPNFVDGYVQQWSLNIQQEIGRDTALEVGYVGSKGTHLHGSLNINQAIPGSAPIQTRRPDPRYGQLSSAYSFASSRYDALQLRLERRFSQGLTFLAGYTFGKSLDDSSSQGSGTVMNIYNIRLDRGRSQFDIRSIFNLSYIWELPFGPGRKWLRTGGAIGKLTEGWQVAGITSIISGYPFSVTVSGDNSGSGTSADRANRIGNGKLPGSERTVERFFDTSAFVLPPRFTFGDAGRYILSGPGLTNFDLALIKNTRISEHTSLQFRAEAFNLANHPNFNLPQSVVNTPQTFGRILSALDPRILQFGLKLFF